MLYYFYVKVLILSTSTGEGHNSAAKAIKEQFDFKGIYSEIVDVLSFASKNTSRRSKDIYIWSTVKSKKAFKSAYIVGRLLSNSVLKSPVYYANALYSKKLCEYIKKNNFDSVVMPHLFPAEALTYLIRKRKLDVKTYFIATDYTCIPFTEETRADFYFIPHEDLIDEFNKRGVPLYKLVPYGIPVSNKFQIDISKKDARESLNMPIDSKCILMMTGSMGYGNVSSLSEKLINNSDAYLYIMGGNNEELKNELRTKYKDNNRVIVLDYTNDTHLYMKACDILFTKPGGLTSSEALACNVPLVFTSPIPGCEERNAKFFSERGMSIYNKNEDLLIQEGIDLLNSLDKQERMLTAQRVYRKIDASKDICEFIIKRGHV